MSSSNRESMLVRALFFASYRDIAGADSVEIDLPDGSSVDDLVQRLRASGAAWSDLPRAPVVAVNLDYAPLGTLLSAGDEIAFIPPVAGG